MPHLVYAAAGEVDLAVRSRYHVADYPAARRDGSGSREILRL